MISTATPRHLLDRAMQAGLLLTLLALTTLALADSAFDDQRKTLSLATGTHPEADIAEMLNAGIAEQKPTQASAVTQRWLRDNSVQEPMLLYRAGQAAELAGDWNAAVSLYRQYLKRADLQSDRAAGAIVASYTLQIDHLAAAEAAYAYAKVDGHRLVASAQARQFDRWFIDEAKRRKDLDALASRLLALTQAGIDRDQLITLYQADAHWLLHAIRSARLDQVAYSTAFVETVKDLAASDLIDRELALLLDWSVSVKAYNKAIMDGEQADAPIVQAQALLDAFPRHALRVQTDWAGSRSRYYRGDHRKYWQLETQAKLAPVNAAVAKLDPFERAVYDQSWNTRYYDGGPQLIDAEAGRAWVLANTKHANQKTGPSLGLDWQSITLEEAKKLAPHLKQNPSPDAAGIRAIASVTTTEAEQLDKTVETLVTKEAWRLSSGELSSYIDRLWHRAGRPDGNARRDQLIARGTRMIEQAKKDSVKKEDPLDQRLAHAKRLWQDYRSDQPRMLDVRQRLLSVLQFTPQAVVELLSDDSLEAQLLAKKAIDAGFSTSDKDLEEIYRYGSFSSQTFAPSIEQLANRHRGYDELKRRYPQWYKPHPLHESLERALATQLKAGRVQPWLVMSWINATFVEKSDASIKLMAELMQSPAFAEMPYNVRHGARQWFQDTVLTPAQIALIRKTDAALVCRPLLELAEDAEAATVADAIQQTITALNQSPTRLPIAGLDRLGKLPSEVLADPRVLMQVQSLITDRHLFDTENQFGEKVFGIVATQKDAATLHRLAPYLWRHTEVHHRTLGRLIDLSDEMVDINPSAAHTLARIGLQTINRHMRGHTYYNRDSDIPRLKAIRGKAAIAMNLVEIPVPASDPSYPIYQSQSEFLIGNVGTARALYQANADRLLPIHRELSVPYVLWVLRSTIDNREETRQEELVKALLAWAEASPSAFSVEQRIALDIAYGDIALQRGMLPEAQQIFARARSNEAYAASFDRHQATLRLVRVQRIAKDFDAALQTLMQLESEKVPRLTTEAHFARGEVYYDMEEYQDASDEIATVLERDPEHADATILRGRVQLKLQKLIEATEVELGSATEQPSLVPGRMLKVTLNDPTLSASSGATDIEVVVWATSGDKEYLLLRQFGDQKTKYRGDVRTALGEPVQDDGVLQVIGDDDVYYAYSKRFRKKMVNLDESRGGPIQVASDAMLMASARKLLSANEQRVADMQRLTNMIDSNPNLGDLKRNDPERYASLQAEAERRNRMMMLETRVKPGSPIYLRVIDPDRGRTAEIDELPVSVSTSSGDVVGRVVLKETGTHTGQFEGQVLTTPAQAMAFASSSESGRNPNMLISPKADYPAWRPINNSEKPHTLTVDLNDNVELGSMNLRATERGGKLKSFIVQTGMNSGDMTPVAIYPSNLIAIDKPWHPSVVVMNDADRYHNNNDRSVYDLGELQSHVASGWITQEFSAGAAGNVTGPSQAFTPEIPGRVKWQRQNRFDHSHVVYRFRGHFYEPTDVTRRFELDLGKFDMPKVHPSVSDPAQFLLAVNGRPITDATEPNKLQGAVELKAGLHTFEIWATGWDCRIGFGRAATLKANLGDSDAMLPCPDSFFDPSTFPEGVLSHRNAPAQIVADADGESFDIKFASNSRARLIRIIPMSHEGSVPALNRVSLDNAAGDTVLPVQEDFADLRKNDLLEILTGDRVAVRYLDDRFVTKGKERHERFLNVAFTDAKVEFADIDPRMQRGSIRPYHERLLRFALDQPQPIVVHDADMDETTEPDTLTLTITNSAGQTKQLTATETGPSTGTFRAWITPVGKPTQAADEIQVVEGGRLTATYLDQENLMPGVPYERVARIHHGAFSVPRIEIAHAIIKPYVPQPDRGEHVGPLNESQQAPYWARKQGRESASGDRIKTRYSIVQELLGMDEAPEGGLAVVHGRHALIEVIAPHLAMGEAASISVYVQTDTGRKQSGQSSSKFDINAPGTLVYTGSLNPSSYGQQTLERGGYAATFAQSRGTAYERAQRRRDEGRFQLRIPLITGLHPTQNYSDREAFRERSKDTGESYPYGLVAKAGERIHIGVKYKDPSGKTQWSTASAEVIAQPVLDVMKEDYRASLSEAYVGEQLFVRVIDPYEDRTAARDNVRVFMQTKSGQRHFATLTETNFNSGIFKGVFQLTFAEAQDDPEAEGYDVGRMGMPVEYGDAVGIRYTDAKDRKTPTHFITVAKGSDGTIAPFSKQYDDAQTAMQTQFAMAESFLELARRHRKLGNEDVAQRSFQRARQLLANTVAQFNDPETRSHAEYLLGNLTMEDAEATEDKQLQADRYQAALARYMKVTGTYEDTPYAAKSQFKIALIYERLGEPDIAAQEYVKLAYKYPDSEHLATSMARLGTHFQRKAVAYERQAKPLLADEENKDDFFQGTALSKLSKLEYIKAAQIFERLQERFPSHELAGTAGLRAGQIYMRAEDLPAAIKALESVFNNQSYDGPSLRCEAMYWAGRCHTMTRQNLQAYSLFKRITYDFPESEWAAYARSQLSSEQMLRLDKQLEIERLEAGQ